MRYTITSTVTDDVAHGVEGYQIADAIRGWYPQAPDDVTEAVDGLQAAIHHRESGLTESMANALAISRSVGLEDFLGVRVARVSLP